MVNKNIEINEYNYKKEKYNLERKIMDIMDSEESSIVLSKILTGILLKDSSLLNSNKVTSYIKDKFGVYGFKVYTIIKDSYLELKKYNKTLEGEKNE